MDISPQSQTSRRPLRLLRSAIYTTREEFAALIGVTLAKGFDSVQPSKIDVIAAQHPLLQVDTEQERLSKTELLPDPEKEGGPARSGRHRRKPMAAACTDLFIERRSMPTNESWRKLIVGPWASPTSRR